MTLMRKACCFGMLISLSAVLAGSVSLAATEAEEFNTALQQRQKNEFMEFFLQTPSKAKMPATSLALEQYNRAVSHFQRGEYELSEDMLTLVLEVDPKSALAYELLGDIAAIRHQIDLAREYYRQAFLLGANDGLRTKLEKIDRELTLEDGFSTYTAENFVLKYRDEKDGYNVPQIRNFLNDLYDELVHALDYRLKSPVVVLLYEPEEFRKIMQLPHWVGGAYDGKVRLPLHRDVLNDLEFKTLAFHELTHAFVQAISRGRAPMWMNEGLAVYQESKIRPRDALVFEAALRTESLLPIHQLMTEKDVAEKKDPLYAELFYGQAGSVIDYLVKTQGMYAIRKMLEAFGQEKNSEEALREITGLSIERLEQEWKKNLSNS